jgi:hypothetical protein
MVYGSARIVNEAGKELSTWEACPFDLRTMLMTGSIVPQPATFFSRESVASQGYLNEQRQMIMDYELCTRIGMQLPTVCLPATLARFRAHPQSKTWLHFETTARELVDFVASLSTASVPGDDWSTIRDGTLSRVHYEWALQYVAHGQRGSKALKQLLRSIRLHPRYALKRPMLTAHIAKEALVGYWKPRRRSQ